jgi:hypothetical protein
MIAFFLSPFSLPPIFKREMLGVLLGLDGYYFKKKLKNKTNELAPLVPYFFHRIFRK